MQCNTTNERIRVANIFLSKIKENENKSDNLINYHTEYFLILCHSILDYIVYDFLSSIRPPISIEQISKINKNKVYINQKINHEKKDETLKFLKNYRDERSRLETNVLVSYFLTIRNRIVHGEFTNIYKTQIKQEKTVRRFQSNLVSYLAINDDGDCLLINSSGDKLIIRDEGSVNELGYLKNLDGEQKSQLLEMLDNETPSDLLEKYIYQIKEFIKKFDSN